MNQHERGQVVATAAEIYETFFVPALFGEWPQRVLATAGVKQDDALLDVACGTGIVARAAVSLVGETGSVTAVDINDGMLAVARSKSDQVTWREGAAEALPFDDGRFDHVVCQFGLMFFADRVQALREMRRVTKPGGVVTVAVWGSLAETPGYRAVVQLLDTLFGAEVAQALEAPFTLGDPALLRDLFSQADMPDVKIETVVGTARFASLDDWIYTDLKGWTLADVLDDAAYEQFRTAALPALQQFVTPDGSVAFASPAHIATVRL